MSLPPFDTVVAEHGATVLRVCRSLLPYHDAQDAAAEALLAALQAYPRLRADSNVKAWLMTIAHRKALDVLRRRQRHAVPLADLPDRPAPSQPDPADETLWQAVRALPPKQRHSVAYRYVADLPYVEIAGLLGITEAAARRNAADGIKALRRIYEPRPDAVPALEAKS